jgi:hypothetical protein
MRSQTSVARERALAARSNRIFNFSCGMLSRAQRSASRTVPPRLMPITIPPRTICASLLAKPGRHFRGMGIDDIAPEVAFDRGARVGDDVGGPE